MTSVTVVIVLVPGVGYLSQYGWYIVLAVVCLVIMWMKLGPTVRDWWAKRKQREEELNFG